MTLPEFDRMERDAVSTPLGRSRDFARTKSSFYGTDTLFKCLAIGEWPTLIARPCADLAWSRATRKIFVTDRIARRAHRSFDPNLSIELIPVKVKRGVGMLLQFNSLATQAIREKDCAMFVKSTKQDGADRRHPIAADGREMHRIGIRNRKLTRFIEPSEELHDRIRRRMVEVH